MSSAAEGPWPLSLTGDQSGLRMQVHASGDRFISQAIREQGVWEPYETQLVQRFVRDGDVFLDAGANIGYFTVLAAACVGSAGRVLAFEPEPRNYALLTKNIELNRLSTRVSSWCAALGAAPGRAELHLHPDNLGDHQLHAVAQRRETIAIDVLNAEALFHAGISRVDFVKIDTQGAESAVIDGLMPLLEASLPQLRLMVELTPFSLRQAGSSGEALIRRLDSLGLPFCIVDHIEHRLVSVSCDELVQWCNNVDAVPEDEGFMNILVGATV